MASDTQDRESRNASMDVSEISTGSTHFSEAQAQENPPGAQSPALDPTPVKSDKDVEAGGMWPHDPEGPKPEDPADPRSTMMGTGGDAGEPETKAKIVSAEAGGEKESDKKPHPSSRNRR